MNPTPQNPSPQNSGASSPNPLPPNQPPPNSTPPKWLGWVAYVFVVVFLLGTLGSTLENNYQKIPAIGFFNGLFNVLAFVSMVGLAVGLIWPLWLQRFFKGPISKKKPHEKAEGVIRRYIGVGLGTVFMLFVSLAGATDVKQIEEKKRLAQKEIADKQKAEAEAQAKENAERKETTDSDSSSQISPEESAPNTTSTTPENRTKPLAVRQPIILKPSNAFGATGALFGLYAYCQERVGETRENLGLLGPVKEVVVFEADDQGRKEAIKSSWDFSPQGKLMAEGEADSDGEYKSSEFYIYEPGGVLKAKVRMKRKGQTNDSEKTDETIYTHENGVLVAEQHTRFDPEEGERVTNTRHFYDDLSRIIKTQKSGVVSETSYYQYNSVGQMKGETSDTGRNSSHIYKDGKLVLSKMDNGNVEFQYEYGPGSRLVKFTNISKSEVENQVHVGRSEETYNTKGQTTRSRIWNDNTPLSDILKSFDYDSRGNWIKETRQIPSQRAKPYLVREITYYSQAELKRATPEMEISRQKTWD